MSRRAGFTILEVLVAGALLALVIMVLFTLYPSSLIAVHRGEHTVEASALAQSIVERCREKPFSQLRAMAPDGPGGEPITNTLESPPPGPDGTVFVPTVTVFRIPGQDADPIRVVGVRATVSWKEQDQQRQVQQEVWVCEIKR